MTRLSKVGLCMALAWLVAVAMTTITYLFYWSPGLGNIDFRYLLSVATFGALYCATIPVFILGVVSLRQSPSSQLCILLTSAWLLIFLLLRAKPWTYAQGFPWLAFLRDFMEPMPTSLAVGLAFGIAARRVLGLGPNNSFKPKPLRGPA
jgi:hypothetical protein